MKDFTVEAKPNLEFKIGEDVFYAVGDTPGGTILDLASIVSSEDQGDKIRAISDFLDGVLLPESADLFAERMRDPSNPINFQQLIDVFEWLLEEYVGGEDADRPTPAPSRSSAGRGRTGRSSTGSVRSPRSTPVETISDGL